MKKLLDKLFLSPTPETQKALIISFIIINFAFLYHTLNFMWGNHDVKFIKEELLLSSGLFEGRFTQFIPYRLLTNGQILPIINNLIGTCFITLALYILAKYWQLPQTTLNYTLFITFFITEPYILSWLYFTFITISCLCWTFFAILGLYLSSLIPSSSQKIPLTIASIICFYLPLGGYPPIINTFFVCLSAKMLIDVLFHSQDIKQLLHSYKYTVLNILIAAVLFKITLHFIPKNDVYNLETTPLNELPQKFISTIKIAFNQFFIAVPFMEKGYKITLALMSFTAIIGCFTTKNSKKTKLTLLLLIFSTIWLTSLTTFLVVPATQYVSRIDFYGFGFLYAFFLLLLLKLKPKIYESIGVIFAFLLIYQNILNIYHALHVWQQGFQQEMEILDNITERIESHPRFNPNQKYRFYQAGDISLRPTYYDKNFDVDDVFLHSLPYLAMWQGENLIQFYSPYKYISTPSFILPSDITKDVLDFINHKASPWPSPNSIYVNNEIIIIFLNHYGLHEFKTKLKELFN